MSRFKVVCKCGHVGRKFYIPVAFGIDAENAKEAAQIARWFPRVKHNHADAILSVEKISDEAFEELIQINRNDEYLKCKNIQQQNLLDISERLILDPHYCERRKEKHSTENKISKYKKNDIKNPKKYFKNIYLEERGALSL